MNNTIKTPEQVREALLAEKALIDKHIEEWTSAQPEYILEDLLEQRWEIMNLL